MMDLRKLRMLAELERLGTIAAVAAELRLTAPGISMQLAALERELGVVLTERQGRRLALTPAGRLLAAHGRDLVDRLSVAELEIDAIRQGAAGHYRIAAFPSAARTFVADAWRLSLADEVGTEISLTTPEPEGALADLSAGRTDLAIVHEYSNVPRARTPGVDYEAIVSEPVWLAINAEDPAAADEVDLTSLRGHRWIAPTRGLTCFEMIDRACGLAGFRPHIVAESMDFAAQIELVAAGVGVALVPDLTIAGVPAGVRISRTRAPLRRHITAARRTSMAGDEGLRRIVGLLRSAAGTRVRDEPPTRSPAPAVTAESSTRGPQAIEAVSAS
jgi:DNA-binding transcriptional LysR family regulator